MTKVRSRTAGRVAQPRFTVRQAVTDFLVYDGGKIFMSIGTLEAATALATLLNQAVQLSEDVFGMTADGKPATARGRVAYAVAKAMGEEIEFRPSLLQSTTLEEA